MATYVKSGDCDSGELVSCRGGGLTAGAVGGSVDGLPEEEKEEEEEEEEEGA